MDISACPGRIVRADIRLDIRIITDVRVELSVQPRISAVNCAPKYYPHGYRCYERQSAKCTMDIRGVVRIIRHGHP